MRRGNAGQWKRGADHHPYPINLPGLLRLGHERGGEENRTRASKERATV